MKFELEYNFSFDVAWDKLKEEIRSEMDKMECIDDKNNICWPCWICLAKREKEYYSKH